MKINEIVCHRALEAYGIELCGLLWNTENLKIEGKKHFTFDEAQ